MAEDATKHLQDRAQQVQAAYERSTSKLIEGRIVPSLDRVPIDVIAEILLLLPFKCLARCDRICKRWRSLINSAPFLTRATKRYIVQRKDIPRVALPKTSPADFALLARWVRGGLEEEYLLQHITIMQQYLHTSGYFTRQSCVFRIDPTATIVPREHSYRKLFGRYRDRGDVWYSESVDCSNLFPRLSVGVHLAIDVDPSLVVRLGRLPHVYPDLKDKMKQPSMWMCSYEYPRRMRVAWGNLKKVIAALNHHKRWSTNNVKSRLYLGSVTTKLDWEIFVIMNAKFTVSFAARHC